MFLWKEELDLGINSIDEQHKKFFEIGNKIDELLMDCEEGKEDYDEIYNVINELKDYTFYHFKTEEDLFIKYNYPDYEQHKMKHNEFKAYIESLDLETIHEDQTEFLKELLGKIIQWIFNHIVTTDSLYKDHFLKLEAK